MISFREILKAWLPVIVWMAIMFVGSTDLMSAEQTSRFLVPFLRWLKPDISPDAIAQIHFVVRKSAHVIEYALLAALMFRAWRSLTSRFLPRAALTFLSAVLFAAGDEFHQSFVASRTSSMRDVMIDGTGAIVGLIICSFLASSRNRTTG